MSIAITRQVFKKIQHRFQQKYGIRIQNHIANLNAVKVGRTTGEGITFTAKNHGALALALQSTKNFRKDDRSDVFGAVAAGATSGDGWREVGKPGEPSLHCQLSKTLCNIHLDRIGFVAKGPDGQTYYSPDSFFHIADELVMASIAGAAHRAHPFLGEVVSRIHPIMPNIQNKYKPVFGGQLEIASGESVDLKRRWKVTFDLTKTCKNLRCGSGEVYGGMTLTIRR
jgi:hypothetical protein